MQEELLGDIEEKAKKMGLDIQGADFDFKQFLSGVGSALQDPTESEEDEDLE